MYFFWWISSMIRNPLPSHCWEQQLPLLSVTQNTTREDILEKKERHLFHETERYLCVIYHWWFGCFRYWWEGRKKKALLGRQVWNDAKDKSVWWLCEQVNIVLTYWRVLTSSSASQLWGSSVVLGCRCFPLLSASGRSSLPAALLWFPLKYRATVVVLFIKETVRLVTSLCTDYLD